MPEEPVKYITKMKLTEITVWRTMTAGLQEERHMNFAKTLWIGLAAYTIVICILAALLIGDTIGMPAFWSLLLISTIALFVPFVKVGGTEARISDNVLRIKAPMVDLSIPLGSISSIECRSSFKPGLRIFGYGGLRRGFGDFINDEFSTYTYAGDSRIPAFIVIGYGKGKVAVFNYMDEESTTALYRQIAAGSNAGSHVRSDAAAGKRKKGPGTVKVVAGIVVGIVVLAVVMAVVLVSSGHVDVSMDEDSLNIDASMMRENISYADIVSIELREDFDAGTRIGGYGTHDISSGKFRNDEFGKYRLAMHNDVDPVIVVHLADRVVVFNMGSAQDTESAFRELSERVGSVNIHTCYAISPSSA